MEQFLFYQLESNKKRSVTCLEDRAIQKIQISSSSSYSFNVRDPKTHTVLSGIRFLARVGPPVIFLQAQRSWCHFLLYTHSLHVPLDTTSPRFPRTHLCPPLQSHSFLCISSPRLFSSFRSTCPNHLNLPLCILFSTHSDAQTVQEFIAALSIF